jgi:hypothetical protein
VLVVPDLAQQDDLVEQGLACELVNRWVLCNRLFALVLVLVLALDKRLRILENIGSGPTWQLFINGSGTVCCDEGWHPAVTLSCFRS